MKKLFPLLLLIISTLLVSFELGDGGNNSTTSTSDNAKSTIKWMTLEQAMAQSKVNPKKIFVDIYTDWCVLCSKMDKGTLSHPLIADYINKNFYPVKLDAETTRSIYFKQNAYRFRPEQGSRGKGVHEIAIYLTRGRLNYPSVVFLDENMSNPQPVAGYQNPRSLDMLLKFFGEDYYKQVDWPLFKQLYAASQKKDKATAKPTPKPTPAPKPAPVMAKTTEQKSNSVASTVAKTTTTPIAKTTEQKSNSVASTVAKTTTTPIAKTSDKKASSTTYTTTKTKSSTKKVTIRQSTSRGKLVGAAAPTAKKETSTIKTDVLKKEDTKDTKSNDKSVVSPSLKEKATTPKSKLETPKTIGKTKYNNN